MSEEGGEAHGQKFAGEYADLHADYEQRQRGGTWRRASAWHL